MSPIMMFNALLMALLVKISEAQEEKDKKNIVKFKRPSAMSSREFKSIREVLGLTQAEYGKKLAGITQVAISRMETGDIRISEEIASEAIALRDRRTKQSKLAINY